MIDISGWRKRQIALDQKAENAREMGLNYDSEHEPVAWWNDTGTHIDLNVSGRGTPLYTAPPQRTWVGLTRTELIKCGVLPFGMSYKLCQAIEDKLKEKNT